MAQPQHSVICYCFVVFALTWPEAAGRQSDGAKFLTVNTNLHVFVDFGEIGLAFIASLSHVWAGYHAVTSV